MNPEAITIEALPAILILSAFVLVMIKIFVFNNSSSKKEREEKTENRQKLNSNKCSMDAH